MKHLGHRCRRRASGGDGFPWRDVLEARHLSLSASSSGSQLGAEFSDISTGHLEQIIVPGGHGGMILLKILYSCIPWSCPELEHCRVVGSIPGLNPQMPMASF